MAISKPRNRVVLFRLTQEEFTEVQQACEQAAARSVSDYARARILGVGDAPSLAQLEHKIADLTRAVAHLTRIVEGAPRAEAAVAGYGPYLAKSGD
jgi:cell fate (sporulation/competence/biofilm development) regulator YlbF (YheA/YmcA/DUF963 family)